MRTSTQSTSTPTAPSQWPVRRGHTATVQFTVSAAQPVGVQPAAAGAAVTCLTLR